MSAALRVFVSQLQQLSLKLHWKLASPEHKHRTVFIDGFKFGESVKPHEEKQTRSSCNLWSRQVHFHGEFEGVVVASDTAR